MYVHRNLRQVVARNLYTEEARRTEVHIRMARLCTVAVRRIRARLHEVVTVVDHHTRVEAHTHRIRVAVAEMFAVDSFNA